MFDTGFPKDWSTLKKLAFLRGSGLGGGGSYITLVGDIVRFMASRSAPFRKLQIALEPIQAGSGDPSPDNVRPISGRTSATVTRTGKNLLDEASYQNLVSTYEYSIESYHCKAIQLKPNTTYTVSQRAGTADPSVVLLLNNVSKVNNSGYFDCRKVSDEKVYTTDETGKLYIGILANVNDATYNARLSLCKIQIELGSTASAYEPYAGNTYTIQLGDTVYGGTVDVTSGTLTADRAMVDLGTLGWYYREAFNGFSAPLNPEAKTAFTAICSAYPFVGAYNLTSDKTCGYIYEKQALVKDYDYTDAATFKTAMSGVQLCYEIAQPIEITLSPQTINSLVGENNVWDDGTLTVEVKGEAIT